MPKMKVYLLPGSVEKMHNDRKVTNQNKTRIYASMTRWGIRNRVHTENDLSVT
jgi:hypothetical protein